VHSPQKIEIQKKTLGKTKKIEKIIIAIVSASKTFCKKKNDGRCRQA